MPLRDADDRPRHDQTSEERRVVADSADGKPPPFAHPTKPGTVTVPGHPGDDLTPGTESSIKKQAGLK